MMIDMHGCGESRWAENSQKGGLTGPGFNQDEWELTVTPSTFQVAYVYTLYITVPCSYLFSSLTGDFSSPNFVTKYFVRIEKSVLFSGDLVSSRGHKGWAVQTICFVVVFCYAHTTRFFERFVRI